MGSPTRAVRSLIPAPARSTAQGWTSARTVTSSEFVAFSAFRFLATPRSGNVSQTTRSHRAVRRLVPSRFSQCEGIANLPFLPDRLLSASVSSSTTKRWLCCESGLFTPSDNDEVCAPGPLTVLEPTMELIYRNALKSGDSTRRADRGPHERRGRCHHHGFARP